MKFISTLIMFFLIFSINAQVTIWRIDEQHSHSANHPDTDKDDLKDDESKLYPCGALYYSELRDGAKERTSHWSLKNEGTGAVTLTNPLNLSGDAFRFSLDNLSGQTLIAPGEELLFDITYSGQDGGQAQLNIESSFGSCSLFLDGGAVASNCDINWSGGVSGSWAEASNWTPMTVPQSGDKVCIYSATVTVPIDAYLDALLVEEGTVILNPNTTMNIGGSAVLGGSYLSNGLTLINSTYTNNGSLTINNVPSHGIYLDEDSAFTNNRGASVAITSSGSDGIRFEDDSAFTNDGTLEISNAGSDGIEFDEKRSILTNSGTISIIDSDNQGIEFDDDDNTLTNSGTFSISNSEDEGIEFDGDDNTLTNSGTFSISNSGNEDIEMDDDNTEIRNSGTITLSSSPMMSDAIDMEDATRFINERCGIVNIIARDLDIQSSTASFLNRGVLAIELDNDHEVNGTFTNTGRIITPSGTLDFYPGSSPIINSGEIIAGAVPATASLCAAIPTIGEWGILILIISLIIGGAVFIKMKRSAFVMMND